jgi:mono/diheme cytochrome c family protein
MKLPFVCRHCDRLASFDQRLPADSAKPDPNKPVSYFKDVRPIFQAQCQGCHQPAKAKVDM